MPHVFALPAQRSLQATAFSRPRPNESFQPLPAPTGQPPFRMRLSDVVGDEAAARIEQQGRLTFHLAGDIGGVKDPKPQQVVALKMEEDLKASAGTPGDPAFFYVVGDVVYFNGQARFYYDQFYYPYEHYDRPIVAVPGNHDGSPENSSVPSLQGFVNNFCAPRPQVTPEAGDTPRTAMTQPNVYWTLETPFATIVGLYTNVPEGGAVETDQQRWFAGELRDAPQDRALLVMLHHPPYSVDDHHSGSQAMLELIEQAVEETGRVPDAVFSGHVHNYQRFTRRRGDREIPFVVCGNGGYWHLHYVGKQPDGTDLPTPHPVQDDLTLEAYVDDHHGFVKLSVSRETLDGEFHRAPRPQDSFRTPATITDRWSLDLARHRF
jgi:hypothetical protein